MSELLLHAVGVCVALAIAAGALYLHQRWTTASAMLDRARRFADLPPSADDPTSAARSPLLRALRGRLWSAGLTPQPRLLAWPGGALALSALAALEFGAAAGALAAV